MSKMIDKSNDGPAEGRIEAMPQGIFVLGMHRSGTSACTRVLNLLGCALSDELLGAGEGNETGHWEPIRAIALNDEILESAGSSHEDWGPINADWRNSAIRSTMVQRAKEVIADHAKLGPLFAIKDPRICRLADVWLEAAADAEIEPLVVLMLRNPIEVAASLETRDLMANGYSDLLWLRHVLDAERFSRGQKRVICRYDELMANWQKPVAKIKAKLGVSFPRNSPKVHREISQFIAPEQHHHRSDAAALIDDPAYSHWLRKTFKIMLEWSERGENESDYPILDEVRSELDRSYGAFAQLLQAQEVTGTVGAGGHLRWEVSALREEAERKAEALRHAVQEAAELRTVAAHRETELVARINGDEARIHSLQSELHENKQRNTELVDQVASSQTELLRVQEKVATLLSKVDEAEKVRLRAEALDIELANTTAELANARDALKAAHAKVDAERQRSAHAEERMSEASLELHENKLRNFEMAGQITTLQSTVVQRQEELAQLLSQLHVAERGRARAEMEREQEREQRIELEQNITTTNSQIGVLQSLLDETRQAHAERNNALTSEIVKLTELLRTQEEANATIEAERCIAEKTVAELTDKIAKMTELLRRKEKGAEQVADELAGRMTEIARSYDTINRLSDEIRAADTARAQSERKMAARLDELAKLAAIAASEARRADASVDGAQWLRDARRLEEGFPIWWAIMPQAWRQQRIHQRYRRAGLFDADAYLALYPDVAAEAMDPIRHYVLHGMVEGRIRPNPTQTGA